MEVKHLQDKRVKGPDMWARVPKAQVFADQNRRPSWQGAKMRNGMDGRQVRHGQASVRAQKAKVKKTIGRIGKRSRKQQAIQAFGMRSTRGNLVPLGVYPHPTWRAVGADLDQHRAFGRTRATRSGQDQGEGQQQAGQAVQDPLHAIPVTQFRIRFLDKDQL